MCKNMDTFVDQNKAFITQIKAIIERKLWKKVSCVINIVIIWSKHLVQRNLQNFNFCVLSCFCKIEVQGSSLIQHFFGEILLHMFAAK